MNISTSDKSKRVLFVTQNLNLEGAPWSLFYTARGLKDLNLQVEVVSPGDGPLRKYYAEQGIKVYINDYTTLSSPLDFALNYDLYFVNTIEPAMFFERLKIGEDKIIWCIRESEREKHLKEKPYVKLQYFKDINRIVFVAEATRQIYKDLEGENNFIVIPNGLDIEAIEKFKYSNRKDYLKERHGFRRDDKIISIIGSVTPRKGQLEFTQAAIEILSENEHNDYKFLMVGAGCIPGYDQSISNLIKRYDLTENIFLIEQTTEVFDYYGMSDIFVCSSYIESFPRVVLEAMAFELPIVTSNVYGIKEQVNDHEEALIFIPGDYVEMAKDIKYLLSNPDFAISLAKNAKNRLNKNFTYDVMVRRYYDLINEVINS